MKMELVNLTLDEDDLVTTPEGYLVIKANVARTGVQVYPAFKCGGLELPGEETRPVNVYRSAEEVGSVESLASYAHKPVVNEHPIFSNGVYSDNVRELQHGEISTDAVLTPEGLVEVTLWFKSREIIDEIIGGKRSLSLGYFNKYELETGVSPEGVPYEVIQTNIRINHVAVCYNGRAGDAVCIPVPTEFTMDSSENTFYTHGFTNDEAIASDNDESEITSDESSPISKKETTMTTDKNKVPLNNIEGCNLTIDSADAPLVQAAIDGMQKAHKETIAQMTTDHETALGVAEGRATKAEEALAAAGNAPTRDSIRAEMLVCDSIVATAKSHGVELVATDDSTPRSLKQEFLIAKQSKNATVKYTADTAEETINTVYEALTVDSIPTNPLGDVTLDSADAKDATTLVHDSMERMKARIKNGGKQPTTKGDA